MFIPKFSRKLIILLGSAVLLVACGDDTPEKKAVAEPVNNYGAPSFQVDIKAAKITNGDVEIVARASQGDFRRVRTMLENKTGSIGSIDQYGVTPLIAAANKGSAETVELLLDYIDKKDSRTLDAGDNTGKTALYYAVEFRHPEIVKMLREHGANPNLYDNEGVFPLHQAIKQGELRIVEALFEQDAATIKINPNIQDQSGHTALMLAVNAGNKELIDALLKNGANAEIFNLEGMSALMLAVENNSKDLVGYLLQNGANINTLSDNGLTALVVALKKNNVDMARHLLIKNADPNVFKDDRPSSLQVAVASDPADASLIKALLGKIKNSDIAISDAVLWDSIHKGNYDVVKLLIESGANYKKLERPDDNALLRSLAIQEPEMATLLADHIADINKLDADGYSAFALATKNNYLDLAKILLEKGAELVPKTKNPSAIPINIILQTSNADFLDLVLGKNIKIDPNKLLIQAVVDSKPDLLPTIIKYGANPNVSDSLGKPVLWLAVAKGNMDNVQNLVAAGAELNVRDAKKGATPLMIAVAAKNAEMVSYLLSLHVDTGILDADGLSALAYAILTEQPEMLKILAQGGADVNAKDKEGNSLGYVIDHGQLAPAKKQEMLEMLKSLGYAA